MMKQYFKLFSNCIIVEGAKNKIICDIQLNRYLNIHDFIFQILVGNEEINIKELKKNKDSSIVIDYFNFLEKDGYGFYTNHPKQFPKINLNFETPHIINNSILDYNSKKAYNIIEVIQKLDKLGCVAIQIRFFDEIEISEIEKILISLENTSINSLEILIKKLLFNDKKDLHNLFTKQIRLRKIFLFNQEELNTIRISNNESDFGLLLSTTDDLESANSCGNISSSLFHINIDSFTEAVNFNSCLNKKISIDVDGNIKNCPSMKTSFGQINNINDLSKIIHNIDFNRFWEIKKDEIKICKDCEFRYICTDCRAFIADENDLFSKPLKCNYNPYEGVWSTKIVNKKP